MSKKSGDKRTPWVLLLTVSFLGSLLFSFAYAAPKNKLAAAEIIRKSEQRYKGETAIGSVTMILVNSKGDKRVRRYVSYRKNFGIDAKDEKTLTVFLDPADIKNTAYLNFDWNDAKKEDDAWLYLPALNRVKRLAPADKSNAFVGSDFSYTDLKSSQSELWNHELVTETDMVAGHECWVIEGTPKKGQEKKVLKETGYTKTRLWVRKDIFVKVKGSFWMKRGRKIKHYQATKIKKIDGIWVPEELRMVTTKKGRVEHGTVLRVDSVKYNQEIKDSFFTPQRMEAGL